MATTCMRARNRQRRRDAETNRNRPQAVRAIEVDVLTRIQHVEPADPRADRQRQQPRLPAAASADRQPPADRRDRHGQAEKQLRPGRVALGQRIPEHDGERDRRQHEAQRIQPPRGEHEHRRGDDHERGRLARRHRAARDLAVRRARIQRVEPRVDEPVESHRRAARRDHRHENPADAASRSTVACRAASSAPASANGSAKTEWLKRTNDR